MTVEGDRPDPEEGQGMDAPPPEDRRGDQARREGQEPDAPGAEEPRADPPEASPEQPEAGVQDRDEARADEPDTPEPEPPGRRRERGARRERAGRGGEAEVVPGADLEPDLVLEQPTREAGDEYGDAAYTERYGEPEPEADEAPAPPPEQPPEPEPARRTPMELAADARYQATGKRKTSVARVTIRPGSGAYTINGRSLEEFFPRHALQATVRQPLTAAGYQSRMDVVARLHGGGVSSQAGALRHGLARALVEADPTLREELKRRGYLTRDPRAKERKKAGLKKARKRPQFSKR